MLFSSYVLPVVMLGLGSVKAMDMPMDENMPGMEMAESTTMAETSTSMGKMTAAQMANMTLAEVLAMENSTLSTLNSLLAAQPALVATLSKATGITILAPNNDAFTQFLGTTDGKAAAMMPGTVAALLEYHVMSAELPSTKFTTMAQFVPTLLTNTTFANVTGGQVVSGMLVGKDVEIMSGLKAMSKVVMADIMFNGGVIHIIDTVLTLPISPSMTAVDSNLIALAGALTQTNLVSAVDSLKDATIFAPSNDAFKAIGSATSGLTMMQLINILEYHVIKDKVAYSSLLMGGLANMSFPSLISTEVKVEEVDGKIFVNSAQVIIADIITSNGVMHVINNVINPSNTTAMPEVTMTTQPVAFAGATALAEVPFTSGISATTTAASASTMMAGAAGVKNMGSVGMAALLGGVAFAAAL